MTIEADVEVEVRYAETDQMGIVHHATYLVWFEVARTRLCELSGYSYPEIERSGYFLTVTGASLTYRAASRYGDRVRVTARIVCAESRRLVVGYEVRRGEHLLATGETEHHWVDRATGRICRAPDALAEAFAKAAEADTTPSRPTPSE